MRKGNIIVERIEDDRARAQADAVFRQPSVIDAENTVLEIIGILKDFGFDNQSIMDLVKSDGRYSKRLIKNDEAPEYIVAHHDHVFNEDFIKITERKYAILHNLLMCSEFSIRCEWDYRDEDALGTIGKQLESRGLSLSFTPHGWGEPFCIEVISGTKKRSAEVRHKDRYHSLRSLINVVNALIVKDGLQYHPAGSSKEEFRYILIDEERRLRLSHKYGSELGRILSGL